MIIARKNKWLLASAALFIIVAGLFFLLSSGDEQDLADREEKGALELGLDTENWIPYTNETMGISLFYPPEWGEIEPRDRTAYFSQRFLISIRPALAPKFFDFLRGFTLEDLDEWEEFISAFEERGGEIGKLARFDRNKWIEDKNRIESSSVGTDCLPERTRADNRFGESCEIVLVDGKKAEMWYQKPLQLENVSKIYIFYNRGYRINISREITIPQYILSEEIERELEKLLPRLRTGEADKGMLRVIDRFDALVDTVRLF